ncbi:MAG: PEP-CTERM sorting domain-containing protein [Armatimonadota bacterium]
MTRRHLSTLAAFLMIAGPAAAQYGSVGSRGALGGNDSFSIRQLGNEFDSVSSGATLNGSQLLGTLNFENNGSGHLEPGFGNFDILDFVLVNDGAGPLTIRFSNLGGKAVYGVGAQFQSMFAGSFDATMELLGLDDLVLWSHTFSGATGTAADGSAVFAGAESTYGNIYGIRFSGISDSDGADNGPDGFAINDISLRLADAGPDSNYTGGYRGGGNGGGNGGGDNGNANGNGGGDNGNANGNGGGDNGNANGNGGGDNGNANGNGGGTIGGGGQDAVPEPGEWAAMGILAAGLGGLMLRNRRKR